MKKGEVTTKQIITIIILIVSFAVILYFIFRLNPTETTNKEICHNSVVLRSKSLGLGGSLDCKTNYLCISGGSDCEGIVADSTIKVDVENKNKIFKIIADEMADCWWMFGEGELDYVDSGAFSKTTACALCTVIEFDEKIQEEYNRESVTYKEFLEFLAEEKLTEESSETYLHYFTYSYDLEEVLSSLEKVKEDYESERKIYFDRKYTIKTGETKRSFVGKLFHLRGEVFEHIPPYLYEIGEDSIAGECEEFVTKA